MFSLHNCVCLAHKKSVYKCSNQCWTTCRFHDFCFPFIIYQMATQSTKLLCHKGSGSFMVLRKTLLHNTHDSTGTQWTSPKEPQMGDAITVMGTLRSVKTNSNHTLHSLIPSHLAGLWASLSGTSIKEGAGSFQQNTTREGATCCIGPREIKVSPQDSACQMDFLQALSMGLSRQTGGFFPGCE